MAALAATNSAADFGLQPLKKTRSLSKDGLPSALDRGAIFPKRDPKIYVFVSWEGREKCEFRDRAGFHADKPMKFFMARHRIQLESARLEAATKEFTSLLRFFLAAEATELPELENELDALLDELQASHGLRYQREQFKAYMMLANANPRG